MLTSSRKPRGPLTRCPPGLPRCRQQSRPSPSVSPWPSLPPAPHVHTQALHRGDPHLALSLNLTHALTRTSSRVLIASLAHDRPIPAARPWWRTLLFRYLCSSHTYSS